MKQVDAARLTVECHEDQNVNYCKPSIRDTSRATLEPSPLFRGGKAEY